MRLRLSAHNGRELEFLTETAAENRRFISLDIDFYISNLATTGGREIISGERMINRYIYSGAWLLEIIFEIRSSIFFFVQYSKFRGEGGREPFDHPFPGSPSRTNTKTSFNNLEEQYYLVTPVLVAQLTRGNELFLPAFSREIFPPYSGRTRRDKAVRNLMGGTK